MKNQNKPAGSGVRAKSAPSPKTPNEALGAFTKERISNADAKNKKTLDDAHGLAVGVFSTLLAENPDEKTKQMQAALASVSIGLDEATRLVADSVTQLDTLDEKAAKETAFHVAVEAANTGRLAVAKRVSDLALLLRGKLGASSPDLQLFGIKPDARAGRRVRKAPKTPPAAQGATMAPTLAAGSKIAQ